jgi:hydrophobic/amphiphilic exporter-1 (mainly G- bacteria), HAE1 family
MNITELSVKKPKLIVAIFLIVTIFGIVSYSKMGYELFPKFDVPLLIVNTIYPGASPEEIETQVTKKIEDNLASLENIKRIRSTSYENLSNVVVELDAGTDIDFALEDCQRKLNTILSELPDNARTPTISKMATDAFPVLKYSISYNIPSNVELTQFLKDKIIPKISSVKGVSSVVLSGLEEKAIRVNVNADKLKAFNLSILKVTQAINANNLDFPTGKIEDAKNNFRIKLEGKYRSVENLENLVIEHSQNGADVKLKDVAIVLEDKKPIVTVSRVNGIPAVEIAIVKQSAANAIQMADLVKNTVSELETIYASKDLKFRLVIDTTDFTIAAADAVKHDLTIALFLVALVILVFLHSLRDSFIVMLSIPVSFAGTIIAIYLFDYAFNLMTLLGLTLVVGILVDDSIVVLENIHRHLAMGKNKVSASIDGRNEIGSTAVAITMVDVIVFFPLALSQGALVSSIFRPFAWVIIISTLLSLFVSFTLIPLLSSRYATVIDLSKKNLWFKINKFFENQIEHVISWYERKLNWALKHKRRTIFGIFVLFILAMSLVANGFIGNTFVELGNRGEVVFYIETEKSSSLEYTDSLTKIAESRLMSFPEVDVVISDVGVSQGFFVATDIPAYRSQLRVKLKKDVTIKDEDFIAKAKVTLVQIPGAYVSNSTLDLSGGPVEKPVQMVISSDEADTVLFYSSKLKSIFSNVAGISNIKSSIDETVPEVKVVLDKIKMRSLGLDVNTIGATMSTAFHGNDDTQDDDKLNQNGTQIPIIVQLDKFNRKNPDDIAKLLFTNNRGELIELSQFAKVSPSIGLLKMQRTNRLTSSLVDANLIGRQIGDVAPEIDKLIAEANFPSSVKLTWIGDNENTMEGNGVLGSAFGISLLLIYFLLVILYNDFVYPLVVLFAIPMSFIGAFLALAITKSAMSVMTILGLIVMMGLVCKNSILIVDFANKEKKKGMASFDAVLLAGKERLRPILMTTIAMVLGMLPIAVATGGGSEWKNGLGWLLVGGLISSMCLTVFIVPAVYLVVDTVKEKISKRRKNNNPQPYLTIENISAQQIEI